MTNQPLWLATLADQVARHGLTPVAKALGVSKATVSQVVNNKYGAKSLDNIEKRVRGAYMGETVPCPVLGELEANRCLDHQNAPFVMSNPDRVKLYKACSKCPHSKSEEKE